MKTTSKILLVTAGVVIIASLVALLSWLSTQEQHKDTPVNSQSKGDVDLPHKRTMESFSNICFENDSTIARKFSAHIIIKNYGSGPQINYETNAFEAHVIKMGNVGVLMVRPNKRVIEKDSSDSYKFVITPDRPIMEIESSVSNVDFELRCLDGVNLKIIKHVSDGCYFNLVNCNIQSITLDLASNNFFWVEQGVIGNVVMVNSSGRRNTFDTKKQHNFFISIQRNGHPYWFAGKEYKDMKRFLQNTLFERNEK